MKQMIILLMTLIIGLGGISAQTKSLKKSPVLSEATPESAGLSAERLARIDSMCANAVKQGNIPGVVSLVARNGKIVHWKAFGMADNQAGRTLKRDDIFRIASPAKGHYFNRSDDTLGRRQISA